MKAPNIQDINPTHLTPPLKNMFGQKIVEVVDWEVTSMKSRARNLVSFGLFRVNGRCRVSDETHPFSMVLKAVQSPVNVGLGNFGEGDDKQHWNYWIREPLFYQSEIIYQIPEGIAIPQCYNIQPWDNDIIWIWLEEIEFSKGEIRQLEELRFLACHLGHLNARFVEKLPDVPWLGRNTHAQWLKPVIGLPYRLMLPEYRLNWDHPLMRVLFPPDLPNPYRDFIENVDHYLGILDTLPPTRCHGDCAPANFKIRQTPHGTKEIVALDWALTCIGVLGQDVAHLIFGSFDWFDVEKWDEVIHLLLNSYLDGLREMGWQGDEKHVWLGYAITVLIKYGTFLMFIIGISMVNEDGSFQPVHETPVGIQFLQKTAGFILELDRAG